ncbi:MAG TPA: pirin family protein [Verrucomicrobiales bacterium]|nr:pirin family protein [Verrucomicrobiales bacterium]
MNRTPPSITVRRSQDRGHAAHRWLQTWHSFSFARYYDPNHMGFRSLRVINQDRIAPGGGFPTHPHRDMEIFSYVLEGSLKHLDSMGNSRVLEPGQIQLMSAGSGVTHSEFNPSSTDSLHLLQIWIEPDKEGLTPSYTEWLPDPAKDGQGKVLVISPDGRENSAFIHQDSEVYRIRLAPQQSISHTLTEGRGLWLQVIHGPVLLNGTALASGDAGSSEDSGELEIRSDDQPVEALLFDLR